MGFVQQSRFNGIVPGREADALTALTRDAIKTDLAPIVRFARALNRNFDAVKNAVEMPCNNGEAEGLINRLKSLKRAMYGRAGPELRGARMLIQGRTIVLVCLDRFSKPE
jgi:transposase